MARHPDPCPDTETRRPPPTRPPTPTTSPPASARSPPPTRPNRPPGPVTESCTYDDLGRQPRTGAAIVHRSCRKNTIRRPRPDRPSPAPAPTTRSPRSPPRHHLHLHRHDVSMTRWQPQEAHRSSRADLKITWTPQGMPQTITDSQSHTSMAYGADGNESNVAETVQRPTTSTATSSEAATASPGSTGQATANSPTPTQTAPLLPASRPRSLYPVRHRPKPGSNQPVRLQPYSRQKTGNQADDAGPAMARTRI